MRSLSLTLILIPLLLGGAGCKRRHRGASQTDQPVSTVFAGDPNVAAHFASGFYQVEANAWRWTDQQFAVDLAPPLHANERGAQLVVKLDVPDVLLQKVASVQLSASIQGYNLEPQTFSKSGQYTYTRDVPADRFQDDVVRINFAVDHSLPPTDTDRRQLGIIVSQVGLVAK